MPMNSVEEATMYFVVQIWKGEINNATQPNEDPSEQLIVREKDCLIKLNQANSRCFREILKWEYHSYNSFVSCHINKHPKPNTHE